MPAGFSDGTDANDTTTAAWGSISGMPAGFSDGVDNDTDTNSGGDITSVTASTGLTGGGSAGDVTLSVNPAGVAGTMVLLASAVNLWTNGSTAAGGAVHSVSVGAYNYPAVLLRVRAWFPDAAGTGNISFGTWGGLRNHVMGVAHEQTFWVGTSGGAVAMTVVGGSIVNVIVDVVGYLR